MSERRNAYADALREMLERTPTHRLPSGASKEYEESTDEKNVAEALKGKGLTVTAPDLTPFRKLADKVYAESDLAKQWDTALMKQVMDVQ